MDKNLLTTLWKNRRYYRCINLGVKNVENSLIIQIIFILIVLPFIIKCFMSKYNKFTYSKRNQHVKDNMNGISFEQYISSLFYRMGYRNKVTKGSYDFGADIILSNGTKK
ncbi:restriction endonuclease [Macrococcus capreoli]